MLINRLSPPFDETTWLQWRMSFSTKLYVFVGVGAYLFLLYGIFSRWSISSSEQHCNNIEAILVSGSLGGILLWLIVHIDRGYRVAYDQEAIYTRPHGMRWNFKRYPFICIPFEEIAVVVGEWQRSPPVRFTPFQFARVYRRDWDGEELFPLVGEELHNDEFKGLLRLIDERAPGTLSQEVANYMNNDYRF